MKKIITLSGFAGLVLSLFLVGGSNVSCNKDTDCLATVTVLDTNNNPVDSAKIVVTSPNGGVINTVAYSNSSGVAPFNFKLPAVLNVQAIVVDTVPYWHLVQGKGVLILEAGKTIYVTINIR